MSPRRRGRKKRREALRTSFVACFVHGHEAIPESSSKHSSMSSRWEGKDGIEPSDFLVGQLGETG